METFVTLGLVLKETRYKESDRILTILTPGLGVISASASARAKQRCIKLRQTSTRAAKYRSCRVMRI